MQRRTGGASGRLGAVLFTDIVGSTAIAAELGNRRWAELIGRHHKLVRRELRRSGGRENDTAGDGFFATFERPVDAIRCAVAVAEAVRSLGIEIRAGVTFGELELAGSKPGGLVVNAAARVMSVAGPGEVLVPASVKDIVSGAGLSFADRGVHRLKGLEDEVRLFLVTGVDGKEVAPPAELEEAASRRQQILAGSSSSRRWVIVAAIAAAAVAAATVALAVRDGKSSDDHVGTTMKTFVAEIAAVDGDVLRRIDIVRPSRSAEHPETIRAIAAGEAAVWVVAPGFEGPTLLHVDPEHAEVREPIAIEQPAFTVSIVPAFDALWYLAPDRLVRVSASTDEQEMVLRVAPATGLGAGACLAADRDHLWIGKTDGILIRVDPSGEVTRKKVGGSVDLIAAGDGGVWVVDQLAGIVAEVEPDTLETLWEAPVFGTVGRIAVDHDYVWLLDQEAGVVTRLSSSSGQEAGQVSVGKGATDLASGLGAVWVSHLDGSIARIDRSTRDSDLTFASVEGAVSAIAVDAARNSIWIDVGRPTNSSGS